MMTRRFRIVVALDDSEYAEIVLEHAFDDADFVVHLDVAATLGANYAVLAKLPEDAIIKQVPELREQIAQAVMQVEAGRSMAKGMVGFDFVTDVSSVTAFVKVTPRAPKPDVLVVVRGTFPAPGSGRRPPPGCRAARPRYARRGR